MFWNRKKEECVNAFNLTAGDIFVKNDKVPSTFIVDKLIDYSPAPMHVRLKEKGGNDRTVTVALTTLLDSKYWTMQKNSSSIDK